MARETTDGRNGSDQEGRSIRDGVRALVRLVVSGFVRRVVPGFVRRSYGAKYAVAFLFVVLLIAGVGGTSYVEIRDIIEKESEQSLESTATLQADSVGEWIGGMRTQTWGAASAGVYASGNVSVIRPYLEQSATLADRDVAGFHYVNATTERIVASTDPSIEGSRFNESRPAWNLTVRSVASQGPENATVEVTSRAYEHNGALKMAFATRVRSGDGVLVLVGRIGDDFELLHDIADRTEILNEDGFDVLQPRTNQKSDLAKTRQFKAALDGDSAILEREGEVLAFARVERLEWVVLTAAPKSKLYAVSRTVGRNVVALVGSSLVVLMLVGVLLGGQTLISLRKLRDLTRELEDGNLDVSVHTRREDEIGRLFESFGSMRDALREQIEEANEARRNAERARAELERQNERLDQFASTVSHDLRNPLTVAQGNLALLLEDSDDVDELSEAEARQLLENVEDALWRIDSIIDDVLDLARRGEEIEAVAPVDLEAAAHEAWTHVDQKDATLTIVDSRTVEADRDRLMRVLENLFRNAIEHAGAAVTVEVGPTETGFYVADDGPGIPSDAAESVFVYGHSETEDGTGLGLSIVDSIAEAHGWSVAVDTDYEEGAKFVFSGVESSE